MQGRPFRLPSVRARVINARAVGRVPDKGLSSANDNRRPSGWCEGA
jgi:hypothetical protein